MRADVTRKEEMDEVEKALTPAQAGAQLGVDARLINKWIRNYIANKEGDKLEGWKNPNGKLRTSQEVIDKIKKGGA